MMMVDDLGGVGVQKRPFCDDVICEQPLNTLNMDEFIRIMEDFKSSFNHQVLPPTS